MRKRRRRCSNADDSFRERAAREVGRILARVECGARAAAGGGAARGRWHRPARGRRGSQHDPAGVGARCDPSCASDHAGAGHLGRVVLDDTLRRLVREAETMSDAVIVTVEGIQWTESTLRTHGGSLVLALLDALLEARRNLGQMAPGLSYCKAHRTITLPFKLENACCLAERAQ